MKESKERISSAIDRARSDLEEALCELEKLPVVHEDSVEFAAHALNNYLTVTGGTVELLALLLENNPDPQVGRLLTALQHSTDLMMQTVGQLRSAPMGRDSRVILDKVDLGLMAGNFTKFYQSLAERKQVRCIFESSRDEALVWTDNVMCAVVLDNLFSNAVKYSPPGGKIWISLVVEQDGVVCRVCDEGRGIEPNDQARLFQRGVRLKPQPTAGESSTGYGLAVTKEFIDKLGGTIWCESTVGEGSCFSFRLPRYQEKIHGPGRKDSPSSS
jgi:signal transduction histidine kinase